MQAVETKVEKTVRLLPFCPESSGLIVGWAERKDLSEFFRRCPPLMDWLSTDRMLQMFASSYMIAEDDRIIGMIILFNNDTFSKSIEFGTLIDPTLTDRPREVSEQAHEQLWDYIFNYLGYNKVYAKILTHRTKLKTRLESYGFKCEGILRKSSIFKDEYQDEFLMACLKKEYRK